MNATPTASGRVSFLRLLGKKLGQAGIEEAREEAERILEDALGVTRTGLYLEPDREIPGAEVERSLKILEGRKKRVPLAYLLGKAHFRNLELFVNEHVLIPRPETEVLVDAVIHAKKGDSPLFGEKGTVPFSFLDIGTGSGAIAIALLREVPDARGTLLDISAEALDVAKRNVEKYGLRERTMLTQGNVFGENFCCPHPNPLPQGEGAPIFHLPGGEGRVRGIGTFDLIVSNPPYLSADDMKSLQPELEYEPRAALDGGKDGLDFYRRIIPEAIKHLNPGGYLAFEIGIGQAEQVSAWLHEAGYDNIQRFRDLIGIERVVTAIKKDENPIS